jgi:3-oxoadipate enol-lactonase
VADAAPGDSAGDSAGTQAVAGTLPLADGGVLAYEVVGPGPGPAPGRGEAPPLLLLRPLGGSMALWGAFRARLAAGRRVVSFDPRGAGRSSAPPLGVTTRRMVRDAVALLDHLRVGAADVFGLSLGGMVASWLAIDEPRRVRRLVLASTVRRGLDISRRGMERALSLAGCALRPTASEMEVCMAHRVLSVAFRRERPDEVRRIEAIVRAGPASRLGLLQLAAAAALHDASSGLPGVTAPALLLWGERDALLRPDSQAELRAALPSAPFEAVRRAGHDLTLEQPEVTADLVDEFLTEAPEKQAQR